MEMPTSCFDCPCYHHKVDDGYYDYEICRASGTVFNDVYSSVTGHKDHINPFKARLDNCPLVPVPPHGRLIDADALMQEFEKAQRTMKQHGQEYSCSFLSSSQEISTEWYCVEDMVENAPTIIPAEEGET